MHPEGVRFVAVEVTVSHKKVSVRRIGSNEFFVLSFVSLFLLVHKQRVSALKVEQYWLAGKFGLTGSALVNSRHERKTCTKMKTLSWQSQKGEKERKKRHNLKSCFWLVRLA